MKRDNQLQLVAFKSNLSIKICILFGSMLIMLVVVGFLSGIISRIGFNQRNQFLIASTFQNCMVFILPAWLVARLCYSNAPQYLGLTKKTYFTEYLGVAILLICMTPALNMIIDWNENLQFPDSMSYITEKFRNWESAAAKTTEMILADSSPWGLISGVLIIGVLTGFAEEMFFRAGLQRAFYTSGWNVHLSIWTAAFIFSVLHFQFYGFVPRLLLGALFGYLYYYSGSILISSFAHTLNNSIVVISAWLVSNGFISNSIEELTLNPTIIISSAVITVILLLFFSKKLWQK